MTSHSRHPPPVTYMLRRSVALAVVLGSLLVLGGGALAAWSIQGVGADSPFAFVGWGVWGVAIAGALQYWRSQFCGVLRWDGLHWQLEDLPSRSVPWVLSCPPDVLWDGQACLWVCLAPAGRRRIWLWLERSSQPERWVDLRRAVYSRARPGADNADETVPARSRGT
jgi:hypothetical protein